MPAVTTLDKVLGKLKAMCPKEFEAKLEKHRNDDIAVAMRTLEGKSPYIIKKKMSMIDSIVLHNAGYILGLLGYKTLEQKLKSWATYGFVVELPTEEEVRQAMQDGSKWRHEDPKWLSKAEIQKAILHSHGLPK